MKMMGYLKLLVNCCTVLPDDTFLLTKGAGVREGELDFFSPLRSSSYGQGASWT